MAKSPKRIVGKIRTVQFTEKTRKFNYVKLWLMVQTILVHIPIRTYLQICIFSH
uniref:Uncharacterized protein n=1 Tax=Megaselia scalaris TaxID=36166 RepID=T1H2T5_MEGSC